MGKIPMNPIIDSISIGSFVEAYKNSDQFDLIINVADILEMDKWEKNEYLINILKNQPIILIPILRYSERKPNEPEWASYRDVWVDPDAMNLVYRNLCWAVDSGKKTLIHCMAGQERSPLALVWYLHRRYKKSIDDCSKFVMRKHPPTQDRREWLKRMLQT